MRLGLLESPDKRYRSEHTAAEGEKPASNEAQVSKTV